jgi:glycosyltransferase involved in cell wall biosynthesis
MTGRISVIMAAYNAGRWIREAVDSALAQTGPPIEMVVVDDGSADDTVEILKRYGSRIKLVTGPHRGAPAARNVAFRACTGEFVAILDADDRLRAGAFGPKLEVLAREPAVGVAYGDAVAIDEHGHQLEPILCQQRLSVADNPLNALLNANLFTVHAALSRRSVLARLPQLHDEEQDLVGDWDLWLRVASITRFAYAGDAAAEYRWHGAMSLQALTRSRGLRQTLNTLFRAFEVAAIATAEREHVRAALRRMLMLSLRLDSPRDVRRVAHLSRDVNARWLARLSTLMAGTPGATSTGGYLLNTVSGLRHRLQGRAPARHAG